MSGGQTVLTLPRAAIAVTRPRVGIFSERVAAELGKSMARHGQHTPIIVQRLASEGAPQWSLIVGFHRLVGAELEDLPTLRAIEGAGPGADDATLLRLEVSENLDRRDLMPLERAAFLNARARLAQLSQHGELADEPSHLRALRLRTDAQNSTALCTADIMSAGTDGASANWDDLVASEAGLTTRHVRRYRAIYRDVVAPFPEHVAALNAHRLGESLSALLRLTQLGEDERRRVIEAIVADTELATIDAAIAAAGVAKSRGARTEDKVLALFKGLKKPERRHYGKELLKLSTPDVRCELGLTAIALCPDRRAEFIAAAWAGLDQKGQVELLEKAAQLTIDRAEFDA